MKRVLVFAAVAGLLALALAAPVTDAPALAQEPRKSVIHYGDSCVSPYGVCKKEMTMKEAVHALRIFFGHMGFEARVAAHLGRFVKADIYNNKGEHVDSIILDRKTGKMRSII